MIAKYSLYICVLSSLLLMSCGNDSSSELIVPETYTFLRDGSSTVSFSGQTTRILMAEELVDAMKSPNLSETDLLNMFRNSDGSGGDVDPFESIELNESTKSIRSKVATSKDFFFSNTTESAIISLTFEQWIKDQVNEVFSNEEILAASGVAGQIADGSDVRYVSAKGLEYDQAVSKSLIGALMVDQILNNYLSPEVLDEADNRISNDENVVEEGKIYTTMEHKWDEAYGYLFGNSISTEDPLSDLGSADNFLNKYVGRVEEDSDFTGIANVIFDAFKKGRAAIVAKNYKVRDQQADIIKEKISEVIAIRAIYYLEQGKKAIPPNGNLSTYGSAFHELSEGLGFVYSLRFTRKSGTNESYFSRSEVDDFMDQLLNNPSNGFWDLSPETLDDITNSIADKFDFTVVQAAD